MQRTPFFFELVSSQIADRAERIRLGRRGQIPELAGYGSTSRLRSEWVGRGRFITMLQFIRDHATGWIAWAIIILICIPFALWGIYDYLSPTSSVAVASVNGTELGLQQYQQAYQRHRVQLQRLFGQDFAASQLDDKLIREQSLERMIQDEIIIQSATEDGLRISDEQLARAIHVQEPFQQDSEFSQTLYETWLTRQGYTPAGFEDDLRRSLLSEQIFSGIAGSVIATNLDKNLVVQLASQRRSFASLVVSGNRIDTVNVGDEQIESYFEEHQPDLQFPETLIAAYVELSLDEVTSEIDVDEQEIRASYEATKANYMVPESRKASHILLRIPEGADDGEVDRILRNATDLKARSVHGEDFAGLAAQFSEDPGSAKRGGDLGSFERGLMDPSFDEAVFAMKVGEVSDPVRSRYGFHIIELTDVREGATKSYEDAREEVLAELRRAQAEQVFFERVEHLATLTFENPDDLRPAAEALALEIRKTAPFERTGNLSDQIASNRNFVEAAYTEEVLAGNNSDVVELEPGRVVVLRIEERTPARPMSLEEARESVASTLQRDLARAQARDRGERAVASLRDGSDPAEIAVSLDSEWREHVSERRDSSAMDPAVIRRAFSMPKPGAEIVYDGLVTPAGDYVIIALKEVIEPAVDSLDEEERRKIEADLTADYGRLAYDAYVQALRDHADIVINEQQAESF